MARRPILTVAAVTATLFAFSSALGPRSTTPDASAAQSDPSVRFTSFTTWTSRDRPLAFSLDILNPSSGTLDEVTVRTTIYNRVFSRSELGVALDGRPLQDVIAVTTDNVSPIAPGVTTSARVTHSLPSLANVFSTNVYPIEIDVRASGRSLAKAWTATAYFFSPPATRINVAWILPLHRAPLLDERGGVPAGSVDPDLAPDGRLTRLGGTLASHPQIPVTLAPTGLLLDEMGLRAAEPTAAPTPTGGEMLGARDFMSELQSAAAQGMAVASAPYAWADVAALSAAGLASDATRQFSTGRARVSSALGRAASSTLLVPAKYRLDSSGAASAAALGVRQVVLDPALVPPQGGPFGPDRPVTVTASTGVRLDALLVDGPIRNRLGAGGDPVLRAQAVLAETASAWLERPLGAPERSVVIATDSMPDADVAGPLLDGLASAPWVRAVSAAEVFALVPKLPQPQALQPVPAQRSSLPPMLAIVKDARRAVSTLESIVVAPLGAVDPLDRMVLATEADDWSQDSGRGTSLARAVRSRAEGILAKIEAPDRRITLTSRNGRLPVTILNDTGYAIRVRVELSSVKVEFPENPAQTSVIAGRFATFTFPAVARATGASEVVVRVLTPDGGQVLASGRVIVRSTAVSAVALLAIAGGFIVLLAGFVRRRLRRGAPPPAPTLPAA